MRRLAPIALFAFNRPEHLRRTLSALAANEEARNSRLTVFCDGPRGAKDVLAIREVERVVAEQKWCGSVDIRTSTINRGLADSIISGVSEMCDSEGRVIVLEDDLIVSRYFLAFLNEGLDRYSACAEVHQVSGHCFPAQGFDGSDRCSFLPFTTTLGWGTWQRAWAVFDSEMHGIEQLDSDPVLARRFNIDNTYPYTRLLRRLRRRRQLARSWGIRWHWSVFRANGLVLYPQRSLVMHIGDDDSGTNVRGRQSVVDVFFTLDNRVSKWPASVTVDRPFYQSVRCYLAAQQTLWSRTKRFIRRYLKA